MAATNYQGKEVSGLGLLRSFCCGTPMAYEYPRSSHRPLPSSTQLLSGAKIMAEAATATLNHESSKIDHARVAGAAADLIHAAAHYSNMEEQSFGKYIVKAEDYLQQYQANHSNGTADVAIHASSSRYEVEEDDDDDDEKDDCSDKSKYKGGFQDYIKLAEGFLMKH